MMEDLRIQVTGSGARRVVRLEGQCDLASAPQLRPRLLELGPPEVTEVVLDLRSLEFIDSAGLGVILGALRRLRESGGDLKIAGAHAGVLRVLEVTGLDRIIPLVVSPDDGP